GEGYPMRNEDSTSYVGAIESCEEFGRRLYAEAWRRGWARADKKVVLGDGSEWIWNQAALHFPDAIHIVDLYHSREHLGTLAAKPDVKPSSAGSNGQECSGQYAEPMPSSPSAAASSAVNSRTTGRPDGRNTHSL